MHITLGMLDRTEFRRALTGVLQPLRVDQALCLARSETSTGRGGPADPLTPALEQGPWCQLGVSAGSRSWYPAHAEAAA